MSGRAIMVYQEVAAGPAPLVGDELVLDFYTGLLRPKLRGRRRVWTNTKFTLLVAPVTGPNVEVHLSNNPSLRAHK